MKSTTTRRRTPKVALLAAGLVTALSVGLTAGSAAAVEVDDRPSTTLDTQPNTSVTNVPVSRELTQRILERRNRGKQASRGAQRGPVNLRALSAARSRAGSKYAYGGSGPSVFDCSGLTSWAYARVGKRLPRTSDAQAGAVIRVARPAPGDLVFFHNRGDVYHVGLYAGRGNIFHASRPGTPIGQAKIWSRSVFYGRVR